MRLFNLLVCAALLAGCATRPLVCPPHDTRCELLKGLATAQHNRHTTTEKRK